MNSKERLLTVLKGKRADRVPVTLFMQGQGHFITQLYPDTDPWDFVAIKSDIIEFQRNLGIDINIRMLFFNGHDPVFLAMGGLNVYTESENWEVNLCSCSEVKFCQS